MEPQAAGAGTPQTADDRKEYHRQYNAERTRKRAEERAAKAKRAAEYRARRAARRPPQPANEGAAAVEEQSAPHAPRRRSRPARQTAEKPEEDAPPAVQRKPRASGKRKPKKAQDGTTTGKALAPKKKLTKAERKEMARLRMRRLRAEAAKARGEIPESELDPEAKKEAVRARMRRTREARFLKKITKGEAQGSEISPKREADGEAAQAAGDETAQHYAPAEATVACGGRSEGVVALLDARDAAVKGEDDAGPSTCAQAATEASAQAIAQPQAEEGAHAEAAADGEGEANGDKATFAEVETATGAHAMVTSVAAAAVAVEVEGRDGEEVNAPTEAEAAANEASAVAVEQVREESEEPLAMEAEQIAVSTQGEARTEERDAEEAPMVGTSVVDPAPEDDIEVEPACDVSTAAVSSPPASSATRAPKRKGTFICRPGQKLTLLSADRMATSATVLAHLTNGESVLRFENAEGVQILNLNKVAVALPSEGEKMLPPSAVAAMRKQMGTSLNALCSARAPYFNGGISIGFSADAEAPAGTHVSETAASDGDVAPRWARETSASALVELSRRGGVDVRCYWCESPTDVDSARKWVAGVVCTKAGSDKGVLRIRLTSGELVAVNPSMEWVEVCTRGLAKEPAQRVQHEQRTRPQHDEDPQVCWPKQVMVSDDFTPLGDRAEQIELSAWVRPPASASDEARPRGGAHRSALSPQTPTAISMDTMRVGAQGASPEAAAAAAQGTIVSAAEMLAQIEQLRALTQEAVAEASKQRSENAALVARVQALESRARETDDKLARVAATADAAVNAAYVATTAATEASDAAASLTPPKEAGAAFDADDDNGLEAPGPGDGAGATGAPAVVPPSPLELGSSEGHGVSPPYAHKGAAAAASPEVRTLKAEFDMVAGEESPADEAPDGQGADKSASARATSLSANRKTAMSPQSQMEMVRAASSDDSPPASTPASQQGDGASGSSFVGSRRRGAKLLSAARKVRAVRRSTQKSKPLHSTPQGRDGHIGSPPPSALPLSPPRSSPVARRRPGSLMYGGTSVAPPTKRLKSCLKAREGSQSPSPRSLEVATKLAAYRELCAWLQSTTAGGGAVDAAAIQERLAASGAVVPPETARRNGNARKVRFADEDGRGELEQFA